MLQQRVVVVIILPNLPPDCQYEVAKNGQARTGLLMSLRIRMYLVNTLSASQPADTQHSAFSRGDLTEKLYLYRFSFQVDFTNHQGKKTCDKDDRLVFCSQI